ncbi:hypothetical protein B296_00032126 [Ensete ventricosum]|uniref:Uncharacterized protein n=1 Tax=Ensete ventricosum TaxID=4639 RepID=A0A426XM48_ENSVE|nr:hypothetical protein B296_00032126 [Ensete ventricosum]
MSSYPSTTLAVHVVRRAFAGRGGSTLPVSGRLYDHWRPPYLHPAGCPCRVDHVGGPASKELGNCNVARVDPTEQELENCNVARVDPTEQELGNCDVARVDPTEQELGNCDVARVDRTEQELENCDVARVDPTEQELGNCDIRLLPRVSPGANPEIWPRG